MSFNDSTEPGVDVGTVKRAPAVPVQFTGPDVLVPAGHFTDSSEARIAELERELADTRRKLAEVTASRDRLTKDRLVWGYTTPEGADELIAASPELRAELMEGEYGIGHVDARGVKAMNDAKDTAHGDQLLLLVAARVKSLVRGTDVVVSRKGDDVTIFMRNVTKKAFFEAMADIQAELSVERALEDMRNGILPAIASVSGIHASEIMHDLDLNDVDNALELMGVMREEASARNNAPKRAQYEEMWRHIHPGLPMPDGDDKDDRGIARDFFAVFCSNLAERLGELVVRRRDLGRFAFVSADAS